MSKFWRILTLAGLGLVACHRDRLEIQRAFAFGMLVESPHDVQRGQENNIDVTLIPERITTSTSFRLRWQSLTRLPGQLTVDGQPLAPNTEYSLQNLQPRLRYRADSTGAYEIRLYFLNESNSRRDTTITLTVFAR